MNVLDGLTKIDLMANDIIKEFLDIIRWLENENIIKDEYKAELSSKISVIGNMAKKRLEFSKELLEESTK